MKIYLMSKKQEYIKRNGVFKAKEVMPFLQYVIKKQNIILEKIKNTRCN